MAEVFLDTNVLVYAFDASEPVKRQQAKAILAAHPLAVISTQVLLEWFSVATRKLTPSLHHLDAVEALEAFADLHVVSTDADLVVRAARTSADAQISIWDAMIIEAAALAGCERVLSEDLTDGQIIRGIRIENPFA